MFHSIINFTLLFAITFDIMIELQRPCNEEIRLRPCFFVFDKTSMKTTTESDFQNLISFESHKNAENNN